MKHKIGLKILLLAAGLAALSSCNYATTRRAIEPTAAERAAPQSNREKESKEAVSAAEENREEISRDEEILTADNTTPIPSSDPNDPRLSGLPPSSSTEVPAPEKPAPDSTKEKGKTEEWTLGDYATEYALPLPERPLELGDYKSEIAQPFTPWEEAPANTFEPAEFIQMEHVDRADLKDS